MRQKYMNPNHHKLLGYYTSIGLLLSNYLTFYFVSMMMNRKQKKCSLNMLLLPQSYPYNGIHC